MARQKITITLKSGVQIDFKADDLTLTRNGLKEVVSMKWSNADRFVWVEFAEVAAVTATR